MTRKSFIIILAGATAALGASIIPRGKTIEPPKNWTIRTNLTYDVDTNIGSTNVQGWRDHSTVYDVTKSGTDPEVIRAMEQECLAWIKYGGGERLFINQT